MSSSLSLAKRFRPVALPDIEHELDQLWRETSTSALATSGSAVSRNTVLSLAAHAPDGARAQLALRAVEELTVQLPSRAIILVPEPNTEASEIEAAVPLHTEGAGPTAGSTDHIPLPPTRHPPLP